MSVYLSMFKFMYMHVLMFMSEYICINNTCVHVCMGACHNNMHMYAFKSVWLHVWGNVCIHACTCTYAQIDVRIYCEYACVCVMVCVCTHLCIHTYTYMCMFCLYTWKAVSGEYWRQGSDTPVPLLVSLVIYVCSVCFLLYPMYHFLLFTVVCREYSRKEQGGLTGHCVYLLNNIARLQSKIDCL